MARRPKTEPRPAVRRLEPAAEETRRAVPRTDGGPGTKVETEGEMSGVGFFVVGAVKRR